MKKIGIVFDNIEEIIASAAFVIMTVITIANVFTRYFANFMFSWSEELARYCFLWMTFFGAALCTKLDRHLVIDFLINSSTRRVKIIIKCIVDIAIIVLMAVLVVYGWKLSIATNTPTSSLGFPMTYILFAVPFSCTLILVRTLKGMVKQLMAIASVWR